VLGGAVVIPGATIQRGAQGTFVYIVNDNQTAELRMVTIKNTEGNDVAIQSGLQAGENVILEGMDKVQDGARVDVQTPGQSADDPSDRPRGGRGGEGGRKGGRGRGQRNGA
jgi:multidrug efflux system membrane fusion protein